MKLLLIMAGLVFCANQAEAYLDGGSGSMLIQLLLGGLVGAGAFIKFYWHKIKEFFKSLSSKKKQ